MCAMDADLRKSHTITDIRDSARSREAETVRSEKTVAEMTFEFAKRSFACACSRY